jgi:CHASE2 domain-containing sensor protein
MRRVFNAVPVILIVSMAVFAMEKFGWLDGLTTANLDTWIMLKAPMRVSDVIIVGITDADYEELFSETSPLDPVRIENIIQAIGLGNPRVIGVDLDTSSKIFRGKFASLSRLASKLPIVWAGDAVLARDKVVKEIPIWGGDERGAQLLTGLALFPLDSDGLIRRYRRIITPNKQPAIALTSRDSFPWAVVRAYQGKSRLVPNKDEGDDLVLNLAGDRFSIPHIRASHVLQAARGAGWSVQGPLTGKIVLLGGLFHAARDEYVTPVGPMAGVELMAQAVESDLRGSGIRVANHILMLVMEILIGAAMVIIYSYFSFKRALLVSLIGIPVLSLLASLVAFSALAYWTDFAPVLVAVVIHQLYDHGREYLQIRSTGGARRVEAKISQPVDKTSVGYERKDDLRWTPRSAYGNRVGTTAIIILFVILSGIGLCILYRRLIPPE